MSDLRRELSETQERLDFAERVLAQGQESRQVEPGHSPPENRHLVAQGEEVADDPALERR